MSEPRLALELDGEVREIGGPGALIGRAVECELRLESRSVSRRHARVTFTGGGWWIEDLGSTNGTVLDGAPVAERATLRRGATIAVGDKTLRVVGLDGVTGLDGAARLDGAGALTDPTAVHRVALAGDSLTIGRDRANDVVIDDPKVSRFHAELRHESGRWVLHDLESMNGTRLDGRFVQRAEVARGSEVGVGAFRLALTASGVHTASLPGRLVAQAVQQHVRAGRCVLHPTSLELAPGELVALIGEAGSGKSTLVKILAGVTRPSGGSVLLDGEAPGLRRGEIGYVPQSDIVHESLTAREALRYGARLRLPPDTAPQEIESTVERALRALDLLQHADTKIGGGLSGGQRRRVSVGLELLGAPRVLLLDEPGSSLDVRLERQLTELLRDVAREGCAVLAITHRTSFLERFDRLLVMGRGGVLRFDGRPADALAHFGAVTFDAIYDRLAELSPPPASTAPRAVSRTTARAGTRERHPRRARGRQARVLTQRSARILLRDPRNLTLRIGQAPLLAAGAAALFGPAAFALSPGNASRSAQLLFALVLVATWIGAVNGVRALIGERASFVRERALGVAAPTHLLSKLLVLGALGLLQATLLVIVAFSIAPLHDGQSAYLVLTALLALTTEVALALGLLLSALAASEEQANGLLPLLLVPQVLCAGAIVAVKEMGPIEPLSSLVSSRWAFAGAGSALELPSRPSADRAFLGFYGNFFTLSWSVSAAILLAMLAVVAWLAAVRLRTAWHE